MTFPYAPVSILHVNCFVHCVDLTVSCTGAWVLVLSVASSSVFISSWWKYILLTSASGPLSRACTSWCMGPVDLGGLVPLLLAKHIVCQWLALPQPRTYNRMRGTRREYCCKICRSFDHSDHSDRCCAVVPVLHCTPCFVSIFRHVVCPGGLRIAMVCVLLAVYHC